MAGETAVFGGSFDPPHLAHVMMAAIALSSHDVEKVLVVPCFHHRFGKHSAPYEHRVEMARRAFEIFGDGCTVSTVEEDLGGTSMTLHTLEELARRSPGATWRLLVGSDILSQKEQWHRFDEVERLAPLLVVGREGYPRPGSEAKRLMPRHGWVELPDISSSEIRKLVSEGCAYAHLVPARVVEHIEEHGLYKAR